MIPTYFRRLAWVTAGYTLLAVLWGYFLRISEAGDGCATDWPLCHGAALPEAPEFSTLVELSHRLSSGLVLVLTLVLAIAAFRTFPKGHALRYGAGAALVFTLSEALIGALLVVFGWVAGDVSLGRILIRPFHVTNTFLLLASVALTAWWASRGVSQLPRPNRAQRRPFVLPLLGVLVLAWTGSWTGLAVTAFPANTISEGIAQYGETSHVLVTLRLAHPILALLVIAVLLRFAQKALGRLGEDRAFVRLAGAIGLLSVVQLALGPLTIALGNPAWMRLTHLLIADLLWVTLVLAASTRIETRAPLDAPTVEAAQGANPRSLGETADAR